MSLLLVVSLGVVIVLVVFGVIAVLVMCLRRHDRVAEMKKKAGNNPEVVPPISGIHAPNDPSRVQTKAVNKPPMRVPASNDQPLPDVVYENVSAFKKKPGNTSDAVMYTELLFQNTSQSHQQVSGNSGKPTPAVRSREEPTIYAQVNTVTTTDDVRYTELLFPTTGQSQREVPGTVPVVRSHEEPTIYAQVKQM